MQCEFTHYIFVYIAKMAHLGGCAVGVIFAYTACQHLFRYIRLDVNLAPICGQNYENSFILLRQVFIYKKLLLDLCLIEQWRVKVLSNFLKLR